MNQVTMIKKYSNRKLYNTRTSRYVTHAEIRAILQSGGDVMVIDNETKEDLTGIVLTRAMGDLDELIPVDEIKGIIRNMNGFGLIEVMITLGIMSVVMTGMMTQIYVAGLQQTTNDTKAAITALDQTVSQTAMDSTSCTAAITKTPQTFTGGSLSTRFDLPDGHVIAAGSQLTDYSSLQVNTFTYDGATQVAQLKDGTKVYYGTFNMSTKTARKLIGPNTFSPRTLGSVYITTAPGTNVIYCGAAVPPQVAQAQAESAQAAADAAAAAKAKQDAQNQSNCLLSGGSYAGGVCSYRQPASDDHGNKNDGKDGSPCDGNAGKGND